MSNIASELPSAKKMRRELWSEHALVSGDVVGSYRESASEKREETIKGENFCIFVYNFATPSGQDLMFKRGTCCGEGDSCLKVQFDIIQAMEDQEAVPPGTSQWAKSNVFVLDLTPALGESNWSNAKGKMPVRHVEAWERVAPLFLQVLVELKSALEARGAKITVCLDLSSFFVILCPSSHFLMTFHFNPTMLVPHFRSLRHSETRQSLL